MKELYLVLGMMLVTFGVRYPVLAILGKFELPRQVIKALSFVPVSVLTAIIIPEMLMPEGSIEINTRNPALFAGLIAILVSWKTKNLTFTILAGMGSFFLWRFLF